jgi:penicillin-binding protein 1C
MNHGLLNKYNKTSKTILILIGLIFIKFWIILIADVLFPFKFTLNYSTVITSVEDKILKTYLSSDDKWRFESELYEIDEKLIKFLIFKEDKHFYRHIGINYFSVLRAFINNLFAGEIKSGASTITMQLARMLDRKPRTYQNKLIEMFRALQLEIHFGKDEILKMYLNKLPYGGNIEGVRTASLMFFENEPKNLSLSQSIILSVIPNNPNLLRIGKYNDNIRINRDLWLKKSLSNKLFPENIIEKAFHEPVNTKRYYIQNRANHLCDRIYFVNRKRGRITTSINYPLQMAVEKYCLTQMSKLVTSGIKNIAIIVINNKSGEVVTYEGSGNFYNKINKGEIDGVRAYRSPGSTLKPFLYGYALDMGLITPKRVVLDVPIIADEYKPENFDGTYRGLVTAEQALTASLNVPAVNLLREVGTVNFIDFLKENNFSGLEKRRKKLGLSMILGGCEVRLDELTSLYSIFPNAGKLRNFSYYKKDKYSKEIREVIGSESAFMICDILSKHQRQDFAFFIQNIPDLPPIAFKTGTSQGRRDAWAIGFNESVTIGIWLGNFDATPSYSLTGANVTVPIMFDVLRLTAEYYPASKITIAAPPPRRLVDAESGLIPSELTQSTIYDYYIPGISSNKISDLYKSFEVSPDGKICYCKECKGNSPAVTKTFKIISPELRAYYEDNYISFVKVPPHNPECKAYFSGQSPVIISPMNGSKYFVAEGKGLILQAKTDNTKADLYWYINNKFHGKSKLNERISFIPDRSGKFTISCSDENGNNTDIIVEIEIY